MQRKVSRKATWKELWDYRYVLLRWTQTRSNGTSLWKRRVGCLPLFSVSMQGFSYSFPDRYQLESHFMPAENIGYELESAGGWRGWGGGVCECVCVWCWWGGGGGGAPRDTGREPKHQSLNTQGQYMGLHSTCLTARFSVLAILWTRL